MKKAPEAFRTISEVSEILDTPAHVLRFWESKFYQVRPVKRAGGRRYYRPDDMALIAGIKHLLQDRGMTIRGVQKIIQEEGVRHVIGLGRSTGRIDLEGDDTPPEAQTETAPAATTPPPAEPPPGADAAPAGPEPASKSVPEAVSNTTPAAGPTATGTTPPATPATTAPGTTRRALPPLPDLSPGPDPEEPRLAQLLRQLPEQTAERAPLGAIAQRVDRLLDRMAEASGTRRW